MQWDYKLQYLKIATKENQYTKTAEDKKFIFWINPHTAIENQSNKDWNTPIHLKSDVPHVKVPLIFWFIITTFYVCFYHQLWVKWVCPDIGNSFGHIGQIHSRFQKYLWMFDTEWNAHQIDILYNSLSNLTNTSSTPPPEGEKTVLYKAYLIILSTSTETSIYYKVKDKIFNLF